MFRAVSVPILRSYPLYIRQWHMLYRFDDSLRADPGRRHEFQRKISANYYHMAGIYYYDRATFVSDVTKGFSLAFIVTRLTFLRYSLMLGDITTLS